MPLGSDGRVGAGEGGDLLDRFRASIEPAWIEEALEATGTATVRRRRLPAEQVIWLVLGMGIYPNKPITEIVAELDLALPGRRGPRAASSSVTQARERLGDQPIRWLFERCAEVWTHASARRHAWRGLAVYGVDGTTVRLPDSDANREHFGCCISNEVKTVMLDREETTRSRTPRGVSQELWGLALAYNLVRLEMERIAEEARVTPDRISFKSALMYIEHALLTLSLESAGHIPEHLRRLREDVAHFILPKRRQRSYPRAVKIKMSAYPRKRRELK